MKKLADKDTLKYWNRIHRTNKCDLQAVCFPDKSVWFNRFFDRVQKFAIKRSVRYLNISLTNRNVLDIGCGRGRWLEFYTALGANVIGVDISRNAVDSCRQKGFVAINGSIEKLPFADDTFDLVNSVTVLQHLPYESQQKAIDEIQRIIKYGGHVILLENTSDDSSPHVWGRSFEEWHTLFYSCESIFSETHYYVYLLRALWHVPFVNSIYFIKRIIENVLIAISYPLEFSLLKINLGKTIKRGLQHLMIFQKT